MRQFKKILSFCLLISCLIAISSYTKTTSFHKVTKANIGQFPNGNAHVNGGGTTMEGGEVSTFVFNAVQHMDGDVTGHLNYKFRQGDIDIQMDIDCMRINGNRATLSGVVTSVRGTGSAPFIFVGQRASFSVQDNGQGRSTADMISDLVLYTGASCADNFPTYLPISGNITIKE